MTNSLLQRAEILIQQNKYQEASKVLGQLLSQNPENVYVLAMASEVALEMWESQKAEDLINTAISLSPATDYLHFVQARIQLQLDRYDNAEAALERATSLNPAVADYFALWASIKLTRKQYQEGLKLADQALSLDPENLLGLNNRSTALLKMDQKKASFDTIEHALQEDPNNPYTHSNYGWILLERGDHKKSLEHFREALRHNPNFKMAQAGMVESMKARYLIYRWFLKYAFWISSLTAKYQWGVIIGVYLVYRLLDNLARTNVALQPFLSPVLVVVGLLIFSTWIISPISNLILRFNRYGRYLLDKKEIWSSNLVAVSIGLFVAGIIGFLLSYAAGWVAMAVLGFSLILPLGTMFSVAKWKYVLVIYTALLSLAGLCAVGISFYTGVLVNMLSVVYFFGFIGYQWLANFIIIKEDNV